MAGNRSAAARSSLCVALACAGLLAISACGGDDDPQAAGPSSPGSDFTIDIELPPPIEMRLLELVNDLGAALCERAQSCCSHFGLAPRTDCAQLGGELFVQKLAGLLDFGARDPSELEFEIDEALAAGCVELARSLTSTCSLPRENVTWEHVDTCLSALQGWPKGEMRPECQRDQDCVVRFGSGYACQAQRCLPPMNVPRGAACGPSEGDGFVPVCSDADYCSINCEARAAAGETCYSTESCAADSFCDQQPEICAPRFGLGQPCPEVDSCSGGYSCQRPTLLAEGERQCFEQRGIGESCSSDGECPPTLACDGICKPSHVLFCEAAE
jgi:hypothetical protein